LDLLRNTRNEKKMDYMMPSDTIMAYNSKYHRCLMNFKQFINLIRILITNDDLREILINFFGEDVFDENMTSLVAKWIYQSLKWCVDLHTKDEFKRVNIRSDQR
jgi:hypothetical protein